MKFLDILESVLKEDSRFIADDGSLLKTEVYNACMAFDENLLSLLMKNGDTKSHFFKEVNNALVFDKIKFTWVLESREFLPDSYTMYKNKIGLTNGRGELISQSDDVSLVWPYKDCVLEGGQTKDDQKRDEIFYNETLAPDEVNRLLYPKVFTNAKRYTKDGAEDITTFDENDNLIIKGNNLLALSSLLKRYEGKVKCIYIDPPYNPKTNSNTFYYNNTFNRSTWLTFMKNRLELAKRLLSKDGVLVAAIDKNEQAYLEVLIREVFKDYIVDCITIVHNPRGVQGDNFSYTHEYAIFVYPSGGQYIQDRLKNEDNIDFRNLRDNGGESLRTDAKNCFYPIIIEDDEIIGFGDVMFDEGKHPESQTVVDGKIMYVYPIDINGIERKWRYARQSVDGIIDLLRAKKTNYGYEIEIGKNFEKYRTVWSNPLYDANEYGTKIVSRLADEPFSFPKSLYAVKDCLYAAVAKDENAIVLDFFGGSGTMAHALCEINKLDKGNRKFILVEQMDYISSITVPRVKNILDEKGSFVYCELKELNETFVNQIQEAKIDKELAIIKASLLETGYISHKVDIKEISKEDKDYNNLSFEKKQKFLLELIDKNKLYVNYCDIEDEDMQVSEAEKSFTNSFYDTREE